MLMMFIKITIVFFTLLISGVTNADPIAIPKFIGESEKYTDSHYGEMLIGDRSSQQLTFWFRKVGANYHQCHLSGRASSIDGKTYKYVIDEGEIHCELSIVITNDSVQLIDGDHQCRRINCGSRASINGAVFYRE